MIYIFIVFVSTFDKNIEAEEEGEDIRGRYYIIKVSPNVCRKCWHSPYEEQVGSKRDQVVLSPISRVDRDVASRRDGTLESLAWYD